MTVNCDQIHWITLQNSSLHLAGPMTVTGCAGAISASTRSNLTIDGVSFAANSFFVTSSLGIGGGAAISVSGDSSLTLIGSVFRNNIASAAEACVGSAACVVCGGAVYLDVTSALLAVANCTFSGNQVISVGAAAASGGAVAVLSAKYVNITNCAFEGNSATSLGGSQLSAGGAFCRWERNSCGE